MTTMDYHRFNIGKPIDAKDLNAWWAENIDRGVITTGFDGQPGDEGEVHLRALNGGDWILAYVSGKGFVGAGRVKGIDTYKLHPALPRATHSNHKHERGVNWQYVIRDVDEAIGENEAGLHHPIPTRQRVPDQEAAKHLIELLRKRSDRVTKAHYWRVYEAVRSIARPCLTEEIENWLDQHYPESNNSKARYGACLLTVNDVNRRHYDKSRKNFRTDYGHPKDVLYRTGRNADVRYQLYDKAKHGVFDIQSTDGDKYQLVQIEVSHAVARALSEASQQTTLNAPPIDTDHDARVWAMRAVVMRQGQPAFRAELIEAYEGCCAISGCSAIDVLEAAHIVPYLGEHTNRTDNGLLLRADIHTLFDLGRLWVDPTTMTVRVVEWLRSSEYGYLHERKLRLPRHSAHHPRHEHLTANMKQATTATIRV
jgi:hypothetical protein